MESKSTSNNTIVAKRNLKDKTIHPCKFLIKKKQVTFERWGSGKKWKEYLTQNILDKRIINIIVKETLFTLNYW